MRRWANRSMWMLFHISHGTLICARNRLRFLFTFGPKNWSIHSLTTHFQYSVLFSFRLPALVLHNRRYVLDDGVYPPCLFSHWNTQCVLKYSAPHTSFSYYARYGWLHCWNGGKSGWGRSSLGSVQKFFHTVLVSVDVINIIVVVVFISQCDRMNEFRRRPL